MRQRTRDAWRQLVGAEAPASLLPVLYGSGPAGREARAATPVWSRARGPWVWDTDGRRYLDFVTGFGVAAVGHAHPRVTAAVARQVRRLAHGYGDVHPHEPRARLAARLAALAPWPRAHVLWAQSGSEAVELAWKSAYLATGRPGVLAFENGYHGESVGALSLTGLPAFRAPFAGLLPRRTVWGPYADCARCPLGLVFPACRFACVGEAFARADRADRRGPGIGAVLVEPIQGRGGVIVRPRASCAPYASRPGAAAGCSSPTRSTPVWGAPGGSSLASTTASSPICSASARRWPAACRWPPCSGAPPCSRRGAAPPPAPSPRTPRPSSRTPSRARPRWPPST